VRRPAGAQDIDRDHYSYAHYADRGVAEGFDALRFSGPVGQYLLHSQQTLLVEALTPQRGRRIVDVGTGTGRAAIGLAERGASLIGLDASAEMLRVAGTRARQAGVSVQLALADAHRLPLADRSVDGAVSLRVLMHALDWRQCVAELCRVARARVVVDFPAQASAAALESAARKIRNRAGGRTEAYRVIAERDVRAAFARCGYRVVTVRRQFVLPINLHKKIGRLGATLAIERALAAAGLLGLFGSPVTMVAER
jgi:ubiquinone/menaquinone biosynthesis C-methylase UbiE